MEEKVIFVHLKKLPGADPHMHYAPVQKLAEIFNVYGDINVIWVLS